MTPVQYRILSALASGGAYSGQALADCLGLSRTAIWKGVEQLRAMGLPVRARAGAGYQLPWALALLDETTIRQGLQRPNLDVSVLPETGSTSADLSAVPPEKRHGRVLLAEFQSAGRGRRGRQWLSPPASGLYLSMGWRFGSALLQLGALSLITGLAAARAIEAATGLAPGLKWPNDLMVASRKLGGCLVEVSGMVDGPCDAVVGIGINVRMPPGPEPDQPWTDLWQEAGFDNRNALAVALVHELVRQFERVEQEDLADQLADWSRRDCLAGRRIQIHQPDGSMRPARALGLSPRGGLTVQTATGEEELMAGEVSVRGC